MKRLKRWQKVLLTLLGVLLVGLFFLDRWLRPYDLETERRLAQAAGVPLTEADLKIKVPSAADDAAPVYEQLADILDEKPLDAALRKRADARQWPAGPPTPDAIAAARLMVAERPDVSRLVHDEATKPYAYFPHSWVIPADNFPTMAHIREVVKWIRWETTVLAADGRYEDAVRNLAQGYRVADHAAQDPTLISLLVSIACEAITTQEMADVLRTAGPNELVSRAVERSLDAHQPRRDLARAIGGETVLGQQSLEMMLSSRSFPADEPAAARSGSKGLLTRRYMVDPWNAAHLHYMLRFVEAARQSPPGRRTAVTAVQRELERRPRHQPAFALTRILAPLYTKAEERVTMADAQRSVLLAAARVMGHKARTGRWPATLDEAMPNVPTDPFTGKPLGYRVEGNGFVVYSRGQTGVFEALARDPIPMMGQALFRYPQVPPALPGPPGSPRMGGPLPGGAVPGGPPPFTEP